MASSVINAKTLGIPMPVFIWKGLHRQTQYQLIKCNTNLKTTLK